MFQSNSEAKDTKENFNIKNITKEIFKTQNIIIYILTFFISMVSIKNELLPFGLAIIAACLGTEIPVLMVFLLSSTSILIFQGPGNFGSFFFTCLIYFGFVTIFKPKYELEERNEIVKTGGKLFWACFIVNVINNFRGTFLLYNLFLGTIISALTYCFYKIFVNGIVVIRDFGNKKAFSLEELIGSAIIIGIASTAFSGLNIFSLNLSNIIIIFLVLLLGWKNGMLLGGVSGVSVGLACGLVGAVTPIQIASFAVAGIIAGLLNKLGKLGVIVGFILGNSILTYLYSGNIETLIHFREIFIASVGLLLVPSNIKLDLEDLIGSGKLITNVGEHRLEDNNDIKDKLNVVAEAISEITEKYSSIEEEVTLEKSKDDFVKILKSNFEENKNNMFYDEIYNNVDKIDDDIFYVYQKKEMITTNDLVEIFKIHSNYITSQDDTITENLKEIVVAVNKSIKMKSIDDAKKKEKQIQNSKIVNELENVKNIISDVAKENEEVNESNRKIEKEIGIVLLKKNIEIEGVRYRKIDNGKTVIDLKIKYSEVLRQREKIVNIADTISKIVGTKVTFQKDRRNSKNDVYVQTYSSEDKYSVQIGTSKITKDDSNFSGDSNIQVKLDDGKYMLAISDGMGTGIRARETSSTVLKTLKNFLMAGFEKEKTIELINSGLNLDLDDEMYASLDLIILDLFEGNLYNIKNGSSNTYIKNKKNIKIIKSESLPLGIVNGVSLLENVEKLNDGDIIVLVSDGILDSNKIAKEDWLEDFLKNASTNNVQKLSDLILAEALDNSYGIAEDDMTVIVAKIMKKK